MDHIASTSPTTGIRVATRKD